MSHKFDRNHKADVKVNQKPPVKPLPTISLLDVMKDGREYESILSVKDKTVELGNDFFKALAEIERIRQRPVVCYIANYIQALNVSTGIDSQDELPFTELIKNVNSENGDIDIIIVTPGGSGQQVARFVDTIRRKFQHVTFILPSMAMSAGTMLIMSGDEIIMGPDSYFGPIDPQMRRKDGTLVEGQSLFLLIEDIQKRVNECIVKGQPVRWVDKAILANIDVKDLSSVVSGSAYSQSLVTDYLAQYKFRTWTIHKNGEPVTQEQKQVRAEEIAKKLCDHSEWKSHGAGIRRETATQKLGLRITNTESIDGLERALKRFWTLAYWAFERRDGNVIAKMYLSSNYAIFRHATGGKNG